MKFSKIIVTSLLILSIGSIANAEKENAAPWVTKEKNGVWDANDVNTAIHCKINGIILMSKSQIDCTKAGGEIGPAYKTK